jgi:exodeoxyribonuclease-5
MELTAEQERAVDAFDLLYSGKRRRLSIGGYAGTGKSTIIRAITDQYGMSDLAVVAPTGKAAHVLRSKGVDATTLHSLIYTPRGTDQDGNVVFKRNGNPMPRVVIVDEASMLNAQLVRDLESVVGHVLYVGDHGQLEPIGDDPGLMHAPDIRLETIHRQAEGSPIIQFAHHVRQGYDPRTFGPEAYEQRGWSEELWLYDVVIVGFNESRQKVNKWIRSRREFGGPLPQPGEKIICLRNDTDHQVWNGMTAQVVSVDAKRKRMDIDTDDGPRRDVLFDPEQFGLSKTKPYRRPRSGTPVKTLWDFGYAITCHKMQGSSAERVAVVDEVASSWSGERWRYTAATRASLELRWVYK